VGTPGLTEHVLHPGLEPSRRARHPPEPSTSRVGPQTLSAIPSTIGASCPLTSGRPRILLAGAGCGGVSAPRARYPGLPVGHDTSNRPFWRGNVGEGVLPAHRNRGRHPSCGDSCATHARAHELLPSVPHTTMLTGTPACASEQEIDVVPRLLGSCDSSARVTGRSPPARQLLVYGAGSGAARRDRARGRSAHRPPRTPRTL